MKLRDLARGSSNPTSFMPALHIFRTRFRNRETTRRSRKSYESVPISSSSLRVLRLLQQTTMVPVLSIFRLPCHPGSPITFPIRTHHEDRNFHPCAYHRLPPYCISSFLNRAKIRYTARFWSPETYPRMTSIRRLPNLTKSRLVSCKWVLPCLL